MSMFDIFKAAPAPAATPDNNQQQPPATPNQPPAAKLENQQPDTNTVQTPGTDANGVVPDNVNEAKTPLDPFKDLWDTKPNENAPAEYKPEVLDPAKLQEVMGKAVLTGAITPEIQARIQAGGDDAQTAMVEAINIVGQQAMMQSTVVANKMMEQNSTKLMEAMMAKLPSLVKEQSVNNSLQEQNPVFSNPAVAPVIDAVKSQLQTKFPQATTSELTVMAQDFVKAMSETLNPAEVATANAVKDSEDFSNW